MGYSSCEIFPQLFVFSTYDSVSFVILCQVYCHAAYNFLISIVQFYITLKKLNIQAALKKRIALMKMASLLDEWGKQIQKVTWIFKLIVPTTGCRVQIDDHFVSTTSQNIFDYVMPCYNVMFQQWNSSLIKIGQSSHLSSVIICYATWNGNHLSNQIVTHFPSVL